MPIKLSRDMKKYLALMLWPLICILAIPMEFFGNVVGIIIKGRLLIEIQYSVLPFPVKS